MYPGSSSRHDHERRGDCGCDEPHSDDRTDAENPEVERRPQRLRNRAQDQQRNRGAAGESMDEADCERSQQRTARGERRQSVCRDAMIMMRRIVDIFVSMNVNVRMQMHCAAVGVSVRMDEQAFVLR